MIFQLKKTFYVIKKKLFNFPIYLISSPLRVDLRWHWLPALARSFCSDLLINSPLCANYRSCLTRDLKEKIQR